MKKFITILLAFLLTVAPLAPATAFAAAPAITAVKAGTTTAVADNSSVNTNVTVSVGGGPNSTKDATLDGTGITWPAGGTFTAEGVYVITATRIKTGEISTFHFTIDKTEPVITIAPYSTAPTNTDITVTASTNEGTLNTTSHTFTENGSFDFVATDAAGNVTTSTVTITNIDKTAPVITIDPYNTDPTYENITVTASTNEGTLNTTTHTFTENGSFDFVATDAVGNVTTVTVTITNIQSSYNYMVTFNRNGGDTEAIPESIHVVSPATTVGELPQQPSRNGYTFAGWKTSGGNVFDVTTTVSGDITVYAQWDPIHYTITFDSDGGTLVDDITADYGATLTAPADPTKDGYTFAGWDPAFPATMPLNGAALTAQWTESNYTVTYDANGGTGAPEDTANHHYNDTVSIVSGTPSLTGHSFEGWTSSAFENAKNAGETFAMPAGNVTLTAKWTVDKYTITFNTMGGSDVGSITADYGSEITEPEDPVKTGYTFEGWSPEFPAAMPLGGAALTAQWTANTYTVHYNINGGDAGATADSSHTYDALSALTANGFTRTGYSFDGWAGADDGSAEYNDSQEVKNLSSTDGDVVELYAVWKANDYTVTYDANGGTGAPEDTAAHHYNDEVAVVNGIPELTGYTFGGWTSSAFENAKNAGETFVMTAGNVTLTASWTANTYTVHYNINGGDAGATADSSHTYDVPFALTMNGFTRTGYTFGGWAATESGEAEYSDGQEVRNLTGENGGIAELYAVWTPNTYTVTYNANGGSETTADSSHTYDVPSALTANGFTRTGYTFAGWAVTGSGEVEYSDGQEVRNLTSENGGIIELYAVWTPNTYTVIYNANGGSGTTADSYHTYDVPSALSTNAFTRTGYTFTGWAKTESGPVEYADGGTMLNLTNAADSVVSLYAIWNINSYTVTFKSQGGSNIDSVSADYNTTITAPEDPEKRGYTFGGWYKDAECTEGWDFAADTVQDDVTLYAKWTLDGYTIMYDLDGGITDNAEFYSVHTLSFKLNNPTKKGFSFTGWSGTGIEGLSMEVTIPEGSTGDRVYSANWLVAKLSTPSIKAAKFSYNSVKITWKAVANADGYRVYKKNSSGEYKEIADVIGALSYIDSGLDGKINYYYKVRAYDKSFNSYRYSYYSSYRYAKPGWPTIYLKAASNSYNSIKLTWNTVAGATAYDVLRCDKYNGTYAAVPGSAGLTATEFIDTGLQNGKTYYYKVKAYDKANSSDLGITSSYRYAKPVWPAIRLKAVSNTYNSIKLTWNTVAGATAYDVLRSDKYNGTYAAVPGSAGLTATEFIDTGLQNGKTYYYKVKAYDKDNTSDLGITSSYRYAKPVWPAISLKAVSNTYNSIKLTWNKVAGATAYDVLRCDKYNGTYAAVPGSAGLTATEFIDTGLQNRKTYYYKVKAYDTADSSDLGITSSYRYAKPVWPAISLKAVPNTYNIIKLTWNEVAGAEGYYVYRSTKYTGPFVTALYTVPKGAGATISYTDSTGLTAGKTYYYKVNAYNGAEQSPKSSCKYAKAVWPKVYIKAVPAGYNSVSLSWNEIPGAKYEIFRSTNSRKGYKSIAPAVEENSYTDNGLISGVTYYYKVLPYIEIDGVRKNGYISGYKYAKPLPFAPAGLQAAKTSETSAALSWSGVDGAVKYEVYRAAAIKGTYLKLTTTIYTSAVSTGLYPGSTYYYKVRAYTLVGTKKVYGAYSQIVPFED